MLRRLLTIPAAMLNVSNWPIAPVHLTPLKPASRRLRQARQQPQRPMTGREARRHGLRTPPAPTHARRVIYGPMPADRFHVDHGRVATVCDRLERTTHQDVVAATINSTWPKSVTLFDWLVIGQVVPRNPAASVCGPSHSARQRKATVLDEAAAPSKWRSYWEAVRLAAPQLSPTPAFNRNQN